MNSKYSDLHIERWRNRASAALTGAAALGLAGNASAAPLNISGSAQPVTAGGVTWWVSNNTSGTSGGTGFGISSATLLGPPSRDDAYDGAFQINVNGTMFQDPTGIVDLTGTTLTTNTLVMSGLNVSMQYFFDPASPTVRLVASFQNPTGAPITVPVQWSNNLGSDSATTIVTTSSGDNVVTSADQYSISWDTNTSGDPTLTFVPFGPSASVSPTTIFAPGQASSHRDWFNEQFNLTVPAGATRRLMIFGRLSQTNVEAQNAITNYISTANLQSAGLLAGLTTQQESEIVNWFFTTAPPPPPPPSTTPIPGTLTLLMTALLLGAVAIKAKSWLAGFRQA